MSHFELVKSTIYHLLAQPLLPSNISHLLISPQIPRLAKALQASQTDLDSIAENPANMQPAPDGTSSPNSGVASPLKWVPLPAPLSTSQPGTITINVDSENSYPCRRCLNDGQINETMLLLSYDPFLGDSPYSGPGPVFVHQKHCNPYQGTEVPEQQRRRLLSVRAYDSRHMMVGSEVLQGSELEEVAGRMLGETGVEYLHVHNAKPGCFAVRVERG